MINVITNLKSLYEIDDNQWLEETIKMLKTKRFDELNLENLIEELEDLRRRDNATVASLLEQIIRHLLLYQYWLEEIEDNGNHWKAEITGFRSQLKRRLTSNLYNYLVQELPSIYQDALAYVRQKTGLRVDFPEDCLYNVDQLLNISWFD